MLPEPPLVDGAAIQREVAEGKAEARESLADARKEIAEAREEILREKDMPAGPRHQALSALDKAQRDVERAFAQQAD